ncbi:MAG: 2-oxo acid dehydrogenase subunit E2 [Anaerolineales bacterium]|nr:2-oxo acid dehydrogenase subunit E2 [Anaerolineales bacterium]MCX7753682.1 2-oxo acid dehydrogenase subunit E2 [Anaerolineales bacterium]MDW8276450.1 dihydrolipoamide acetyltransferase family protein [Anaerolineales bacterium]
MKAVIMPKFGFTQEESEILEWKVKNGDRVEQGDPLAVVSTDKVSMEVEAPEDGIVAGIRHPQGTVVRVTDVIAYILQPGESLPAEADAPVVEQPAPQVAPAASEPLSQPTPVAARLAADLGVNLAEIPGTGPGGRITRADVERYATRHAPDKLRAVPAARRLARELGVNLNELTGSGPRRRIQSEDVRRAAQERVSAASHAAVTEAGSRPVSFREVPLQGMRKTIATNMLRSWQSIPTIHLEVDVDMEASLALLLMAQQRAGERRVSLTAVVVKAVAWALRQHPRLNAHLEGEVLREWHEVHLGVAVALEDGLIVPVLHHPDRKGILQIAEELNDLASRARQNQLRLTDLQDATFTISNLGMFGIDRFTAIINPPQVAILAVSAIKKTFVANETGQPVLHSVMNLRLSADHRAIDGAIAARFLADLRKALETPSEMLLWQ